MRIGMVMDSAYPPDARVENEARVLLENGYEVSLFCIDFSAFTGQRSSSEETRADLTKGMNGRWPVRMERDEHEGVDIWRLKGGRLLYKLSALVYTVPLFSWWMTLHIRRFIRKSGVQALHIHDMVIAQACMAANRSFRLPVVLDLHENRPEIMKLYRHVNRWPGRWLIRLERWKQKERELMRRADHVVVVTEPARHLVARTDSVPLEKTTALPNVVWPESQDSPPIDAELEERTRGRFTLLYIGDTSLRRGMLTLLQAMEQIRGKIPELQLLLVGSSSQDQALRRFVKERSLQQIVRFEGWQPPDRLHRYMHAADICLSPLLRNLHHDTTYANKLFQYMAAGRPVVASDCPAQADLVLKEGCGVVFRAGDVLDLGTKILELSRDSEARVRMGESGKRAVMERWNWRVTGPGLIRIYEELLSEKVN